MNRLQTLQKEIGDWNRVNFVGDLPLDKFLGVVEEVGELSHAILKRKQGVRGTPQELYEKELDAIGDIMIFLLGYCNLAGHDLSDILENTWAQVRQRRRGEGEWR